MSSVERPAWPRIEESDLSPSPAPGRVRLACVQSEPRIGDAPHNLERTLSAMTAAGDAGASLVSFTEASLTGYCFSDREEAMRFALSADGAEVAAVQQACAELGISAVVGFIERVGDRLANAAMLLDSRGVRAHYRKTHLPHLGVDRWVDPGCDPLVPVEAAGLKVGLLICYDASFPEATRTLALKGADLVLLPTNWPEEAEIKGNWLPNTRAYENVIYFASINRVGTERGYRFHGASRVCDPTGGVLVQGPRDREALLLCDLDPARARTKRIERRGGEYWIDRIAHRREDLYETQTRPARSETAGTSETPETPETR